MSLLFKTYHGNKKSRVIRKSIILFLLSSRDVILSSIIALIGFENQGEKKVYARINIKMDKTWAFFFNDLIPHSLQLWFVFVFCQIVNLKLQFFWQYPFHPLLHRRQPTEIKKIQINNRLVMSKNTYMFTIKPWCLYCCNKKLWA